MRILLIEDDSLIGDGLKVGLENLGFSVDWFRDGLEGMDAIALAPYEAVILDLRLPSIDGLSILKNWRCNGRDEPILILTAKADVDNRVTGLENGADDYLAKPFALAEVAARLKALIRRRHNNPEPLLIHGNLVFKPETRTVTFAGKDIALSPKELSVLETLLLNKNKILSKASIEEKIYSWDEDVQSNAIEVHVHNLRKKIGKNIIRTMNKIGYTLGDL